MDQGENLLELLPQGPRLLMEGRLPFSCTICDPDLFGCCNRAREGGKTFNASGQKWHLSPHNPLARPTVLCPCRSVCGGGERGSTHDIQWVVNTSATIPVANGFRLWSHLPRAGEGRVQRYVFMTLCLPLYALSVLPSYMTDHSYTPQEIMLIFRSHHPSVNMYKMLGNFPY